MAVVLNVTAHVVPLTVGLLAPRASKNVDPDLPLEASLIADGLLVVTDADQNPPAPITPPGDWQPTKQSAADLPLQGNKHGDVRIARDTLSPFVWDADTEEWGPLTVAADAAGASLLTFQQQAADESVSPPFPLPTGGTIIRAFVSLSAAADADVSFQLKINGTLAATLTVDEGDTEADVDDLNIDVDAGDRPTVNRVGTAGGAALIVLYRSS